MKLLKKNSKGTETGILRNLLSHFGYLPVSGTDTEAIFDDAVYDAVVRFQKDSGLSADGIVGYDTFERLIYRNGNNGDSPTDTDYKLMGILLECSPAAILAVQEVETGGRGGFFAPGKPAILFEGHILWSELKKRGQNPEDLLKCNPGYSDILYPQWTTKHYLGGIKEYDRLDRAIAINRDAALCSASWGMFQIMGNNHTVCGKKTVDDFVEAMKSGELAQMLLFCRFIRGNSRLAEAIRDIGKDPDWTTFARYYNGPAYAKNDYHGKLDRAYTKYK